MGFGKFRFRRSFGNVTSQFRGARFDTYPLLPYPLNGRVLDLSKFTYTSVEAPDISDEDNDAVLYSGKGVNLDGTGDYVELPNVGATKSITVLVRSGTSSTLYATDDAAQTEDASVALVADNTWQEVTLTFTNAISGAIRLGTDGTSSYIGDLADARLYDASSNLLDEFYLSEHTDTGANGLDGLPVVGRNGNIGQYVGCAAIVQEGLSDTALAGLGAYADKMWFDGVDDDIDTGAQLLPETADFTLTIEFIPVADGEGLFDQGTGPQAGRLYSSISSNKVRVFCSNFGAIIDSTTTVNYGELNTLVFSVTSGTASISLNSDTPVTTSAGAIDQVSNFEIGRAYPIGDTFNGLYKSLTIGATTWDGTEAQAISNGWTVNGSPNTIGELREQPPQVLGLNFNLSSGPAYAAQFDVKTDNAGTSNSDQITLPFLTGGTFDCVVDWGDGNTDTITTYNDPAWTHTYSAAGTYTVTITGEVGRMYFNNGGDCLKLVGALNVGIIGLGVANLQGDFFGCANVTSVIDDLAQVSTKVASWQSKFNGAGITGAWDVKLPPNLANLNACFFVSNLTSWLVDIPATVTNCQNAWYGNNLTSWAGAIPATSTCTNYTNAFALNALDETSVNFILTQIDAAGTSNGTLSISGGTNAAPTGAGATAVTNLQSRGWTVSTN